MKIFFILLLILTSTFSNASVDVDHPYLQIAKSSDGTGTIYIGAVGSMLPRKTKNGDVIFQTMFIQDEGQNGMLAGEEFESVMLANCDNQIYKMVTVWHKPSKDLPGKLTFPVETLGKDLANALTKQEASKISPNSIIAKVVDAACNYVNYDKKKPENHVKKIIS
jgi:hypothetical protein